jgi:hypothetical protein
MTNYYNKFIEISFTYQSHTIQLLKKKNED